MAIGHGGKKLLHLASQVDFLETSQFLLTKGADVNAKDDLGNTPLDTALKNRRVNMLDFLLMPFFIVVKIVHRN